MPSLVTLFFTVNQKLYYGAVDKRPSSLLLPHSPSSRICAYALVARSAPPRIWAFLNSPTQYNPLSPNHRHSHYQPVRWILTLFFCCVYFQGSALAACVKANKANLRLGPGLNHEKSWEVPENTPLRIIESKGQWLKVEDMDGDKHWIFKRLITKDYYCGSVKVREANLREGPGTQFKKAKSFPVLRYASFKVVKIKKDWVQVKDKSGTYWVFRDLLWIN